MALVTTGLVENDLALKFIFCFITLIEGHRQFGVHQNRLLFTPAQLS